MKTELSEIEYREEVRQRLIDYMNEEGTREELNTIVFSSGSDLDFILDDLEYGDTSLEDCLDYIIPVWIEYSVAE